MKLSSVSSTSKDCCLPRIAAAGGTYGCLLDINNDDDDDDDDDDGSNNQTLVSLP